MTISPDVNTWLALGSDVSQAAFRTWAGQVEAEIAAHDATLGGLGTAATKNTGIAAGNVVELVTGGKLPAVSGELLTNLPPTGPTLDTPIASTSGTAIDFLDVPAGTTRITVMFAGLSTNGTAVPIIQLGDAGGVETTGYFGSGGLAAASSGAANQTTGFGLASAGAAASVLHGAVTLFLSDFATNLWVASGVLGRSDAAGVHLCGGSKSLSAELDRVRITTVGGTNTFDAGTVNIMFE